MVSEPKGVIALQCRVSYTAKKQFDCSQVQPVREKYLALDMLSQRPAIQRPAIQRHCLMSLNFARGGIDPRLGFNSFHATKSATPGGCGRAYEQGRSPNNSGGIPDEVHALQSDGGNDEDGDR